MVLNAKDDISCMHFGICAISQSLRSLRGCSKHGIGLHCLLPPLSALELRFSHVSSFFIFGLNRSCPFLALSCPRIRQPSLSFFGHSFVMFFLLIFQYFANFLYIFIFGLDLVLAFFIIVGHSFRIQVPLSGHLTTAGTACCSFLSIQRRPEKYSCLPLTFPGKSKIRRAGILTYVKKSFLNDS